MDNLGLVHDAQMQHESDDGLQRMPCDNSCNKACGESETVTDADRD